MPVSSTPRHRRVRRAGIAILVVGWCVAALVYARSGDDADVDGLDGLARQREYQALARVGGQAAVQTAKFDQWLSSLWQGRRLAGTLAVLVLLAGAGCLWVGGLMAEDGDD